MITRRDLVRRILGVAGGSILALSPCPRAVAEPVPSYIVQQLHPFVDGPGVASEAVAINEKAQIAGTTPVPYEEHPTPLSVIQGTRPGAVLWEADKVHSLGTLGGPNSE